MSLQVSPSLIHGKKACSLPVKKLEEQMTGACFQASCSLSTPAFDRETQTSYRSHPQNPVQEDLWITGTSLLLLQRTTKKASDLQVSDF